MYKKKIRIFIWSLFILSIVIFSGCEVSEGQKQDLEPITETKNQVQDEVKPTEQGTKREEIKPIKASTGWLPLDNTGEITAREDNMHSDRGIIDLSNASEIPLDARVTDIYFAGNVQGNFGNIVKQIYSPERREWYSTFVGLDMINDLPTGLKVRQQWYIQFYVEQLFSPFVTWETQVRIEYEYDKK